MQASEIERQRQQIAATLRVNVDSPEWVADAVFAEEKAVVAHEKNDRIVELAGLLQRVEQHAHALVDRGHTLIYLLNPRVVRLARNQRIVVAGLFCLVGHRGF